MAVQDSSSVLAGYSDLERTFFQGFAGLARAGQKTYRSHGSSQQNGLAETFINMNELASPLKPECKPHICRRGMISAEEATHSGVQNYIVRALGSGDRGASYSERKPKSNPTWPTFGSYILLVLLCCGSAPYLCGQGTIETRGGGTEALHQPSPDASAASRDSSNFLAGRAAIATSDKQTGVDWLHLASSSLSFLAIQHAFRCATERGTRDGFGGPVITRYLDSVGNLHGWGDGDPFLVNYVGHPMQGAVAGFIWQHNDRAYRTVGYGKNLRYWKGKLRGAAFAYLYSVQFEIGPLGEASIGHIQGLYPQQGFVDHVTTPAIGLGWSIAEDSIDRYLIRAIEAHTSNFYLRALVRAGLNPARSAANTMNREFPWHRDDRPGTRRPYPESAAVSRFIEQATIKPEVHPPPGVAPFEFTIEPVFKQYFGSGAKGSCVGGGSSAAIRVADEWQIVAEVHGCKLLDLPKNLSGDSLTYMVGPRWTPNTSGRWNAHAHFLAGGTKLTQERLYPELRAEVIAEIYPKPLGNEQHSLYTQQWETNGFAIAAGTGVDYKINNALAIRVASFDYSRSWTNNLNAFNYSSGLQFTTGLVLRMGTW